MLAFVKPALVTLTVIGAAILVAKDPLKPEYRPRIVTELSPDFYARKAATPAKGDHPTSRIISEPSPSRAPASSKSNQ